MLSLGLRHRGRGTQAGTLLAQAYVQPYSICGEDLDASSCVAAAAEAASQTRGGVTPTP